VFFYNSLDAHILKKKQKDIYFYLLYNEKYSKILVATKIDQDLLKSIKSDCKLNIIGEL